MRTRDCDAGTRAGRFRKAVEFADAARDLTDLSTDDADRPDAVVAMSVLSGIASADVVCCARLGRYASAQNHQEAVSLLRETGVAGAAAALGRLLSVKSQAEYVAASASRADLQLAERAASQLLELARQA